ncbi:class I SAM-dependent methyltransferase [Wenzhouxiangella sp. XN79A]|uniref:class I SAM-dependent methyltransferase n=1 Tax=Wenzhouxiangella sp. XN79A TaxID=2724193 RepID=UPI00144A5D17|nr:class I SAM-dependent methyltransferase [Wenzhouxiangella sp. XN79A]NKI35801.1 class I SAM-dependent methyltransferase [Wenzhouxiangella sp. XN79A]
MKRIPEPELMDSQDQVEAYAAADFADGNRAFSERVAEALAGAAAGTLIDLGCGPGDICRRLAAALPAWSIEGLDAGPNMLETAERDTVGSPHADRIRYRLARLPDPSLASSAYQAVVSNSLLHHLPDPSALWQAVVQLAAPGAYVQVMDLDRPDTPTAARSLVEAYARDEPEVLREDFFNSLCAAWTAEEVRDQLAQAGLALAVERVSDRHWLVHGRLPA